jgi:hypothetical protein
MRIVWIGVAREVAHVGRFVVLKQRPAQPEFVAVVQVWLVGRSVSVQRIEIETRRAKIHQRIRIVVLLQARRGIEGDVVIDELP